MTNPSKNNENIKLELSNPWTVNALRDWRWRERLNIIFLMERMIDASNLERICNICGFVDGVCLRSSGNSGGIGLWWRDINVEVRSYSTHHFAVDVCDHHYYKNGLRNHSNRTVYVTYLVSLIKKPII